MLVLILALLNPARTGIPAAIAVVVGHGGERVRGHADAMIRYRHSSSRSRRTASLAGFFDLSHVVDIPLR